MELVGRVRATLFKASQNLNGESGDGLRDVNATASVHDHRRALKAETGRRSIFRKPAIQFGFENMGFSAARYQQCGNEEHYTSDALRRRKRLRQDPGVVEWLHQFFSLFKKDTAGCASKEEVISVQVRMAKVLFSPQDWNEAETVSLAHFDWKREMGEAECMTRNAFCDSLFEVVDLWTTGISVEEYQSFLQTLFERITCPCPRTGRRWTIISEISSLQTKADGAHGQAATEATAMTPPPASRAAWHMWRQMTTQTRVVPGNTTSRAQLFESLFEIHRKRYERKAGAANVEAPRVPLRSKPRVVVKRKQKITAVDADAAKEDSTRKASVKEMTRLLRTMRIATKQRARQLSNGDSCAFFCILNRNGTGSINLDELRDGARRILKLSESQVSEAGLRALLEAIDTNCNGTIEIDELQCFLGETQQPHSLACASG